MAREKRKGLWFSYFIFAVELMFVAACILFFVLKNAETAPYYKQEAQQWMRRAIIGLFTAGTAFTSIKLSQKNKTGLTVCFALISFGLAVAFVRAGAVNHILQKFNLFDSLSYERFRIAGFRFSAVDILTLLLVAVASILPMRLGRIRNVIKEKREKHNELVAKQKEEKQQKKALAAQKAAELEAARKLHQEKASEPSVIDREAYCELFKHTLLLMITFGIWNFIWIYRMTKHLNCVKDEEYRNPTKKLLLCMFVPFYSVYWLYKSAQRVDKLTAQQGISGSISTLCLISALFIGVVPTILIQDRVNTITTGKVQTAEKSVSASFYANVEAIEKLAKLHHQGILTDEEFQQKKTDLLAKM